MRQLTLLQRQRITLSLFFTVALGAVFTVAAPAFVPWQVVDNKRAQALDQQRRQGKDFHILENHRRRAGSVADVTTAGTAAGTTTSLSSSSQEAIAEANPGMITGTPSSLSHQSMIIPLLADRNKKQSDSSITITQESDISTPEPTKKKRRRRRKRTTVNEGWQELTGRTAREEKERHGEGHAEPQNYNSSSGSTAVGVSGGKKIRGSV